MQSVQGQMAPILELIEQHYPRVFQDLHRIESFSAGGATAALAAVIALLPLPSNELLGAWQNGGAHFLSKGYNA